MDGQAKKKRRRTDIGLFWVTVTTNKVFETYLIGTLYKISEHITKKEKINK